MLHSFLGGNGAAQYENSQSKRQINTKPHNENLVMCICYQTEIKINLS